jgi:hypothetical protein
MLCIQQVNAALRDIFFPRDSELWRFQASNSEGIKPGICAEYWQIILDRLRDDHAIKLLIGGMGPDSTRHLPY